MAGADTYDVVVVGAGLIGLATASALLARHPGCRVAVLDKERQVGAHQSSHNSGVIHAGVYYTPGSLKARLCTKGKALLERFALEHGIPFERCGKLIVALRPEELGRLEMLRTRALKNGVEDVTELDSKALRDVEPNAVGLRALCVPSTGIIDFARVAQAYAEDFRGRGGTLLLDRRVEQVTTRGTYQALVTPGGEILSRWVIACAGLHADRLVPGRRDLQIVPFRGDYYTLVPHRRSLVRGLIYPVPDPSLPFLGVHFTRRIDGDVWAGPNAVLALHREGYRRRDLDARDLAETVRFPGFWRLARRYWRLGATEVWRDVVKSAYVRELQRYVPAVRSEDLRFGPSGVRAQAVASDGALVDDFSIVETPAALHVRNAPSPGATASLAIGAYLAERASGKFELR